METLEEEFEKKKHFYLSKWNETFYCSTYGIISILLLHVCLSFFSPLGYLFKSVFNVENIIKNNVII